MKTVFLVRHAKSSWDHPNLRDHERPLNERGLNDAPAMAKMLKKNGVQVDAIFTSPAVRAFTTASFFKDALGLEGDDFYLRDEIYDAMPQSIIRVIHTLPGQLNTVMLFGHNPTFTSVANQFTNRPILNLPTCGIVHIEGGVKNWSEFTPGNAKVKEMFFPKDL